MATIAEVSISEFRKNLAHYTSLAAGGDIIITKDGKPYGRWISAEQDKVSRLMRRAGSIDSSVDFDAVRSARLGIS